MKFYPFNDLSIEENTKTLLNKIKNEKLKVGQIFKKMIEYSEKNKNDTDKLNSEMMIEYLC